MEGEFPNGEPPEFLRSHSGGSVQFPTAPSSFQPAIPFSAPGDFLLDPYNTGYDQSAFVGYAAHVQPGPYAFAPTTTYAHESMFQAAIASQMNPMILLSNAAERHPGAGMGVHASGSSQSVTQTAPPPIISGPSFDSDSGQYYSWHDGVHRSSSVASSNTSSRAESPSLQVGSHLH